MNEKKEKRRHNALAPLLCAALAVLTGCVSAPPSTPEVPRQAGTNAAEAVRLFPQYRPSVIPGADHATCEIYLENLTTNSLWLRRIFLDGEAVPPVLQANAAARAKVDVCWWQFYPSPHVEPQGAAVAQVNFLHSPKTARTLEVECSDGRRFPCSLPARDYYRRAQLTAITYELDGSKVYVKYEGMGSPVTKLFLDRRPVNFKALLPSESPASGVLMAAAPINLRTGLPLHVKVEFQDGTRCDALVRVMRGIMKDVFFNANAAVRQAVSADSLKSLPLQSSPADVTCTDLKNGEGYSVPGETADRVKAFTGDPGHLKALEFCTGRFTELWDMYGALDDACTIGPFSFLFGPDRTRHIVWEDKIVERAVRAVRPRPVVWVGRFSRGESRRLEPGELTQLVWLALAHGCKGISYFIIATDKEQRAFLNAASQLAEADRLNREITRNEALLAPMIPMGETVLGDTESGVKATLCWAGDRGMLLILRNLDVTVRPEAGQGSAFTARAKSDVSFDMKLPPWMPQTVRVTDLSTGEPVRFKVYRYRRLVLVADRVENVRLIWIEAIEREAGGNRR